MAAEVQAFTLADPEWQELLLPAQDPADSGIDSDATDNDRRDRRQGRLRHGCYRCCQHGIRRTAAYSDATDNDDVYRGRHVVGIQSTWLLEPLLPAWDPADSGIDSDATDNDRRDRRQGRLYEDSIDEESDVTVEIEMPIPYCAQHPNLSFADHCVAESAARSAAQAVRVSPSLFEVELTASDEDDVSVLELIIPYQKPRYKKLPTSPPLKPRIRAPRYLCGLLCCFRK
ncbi:uncharacterized protein LOC125234914 [Leguminivora glycinivorella]|uniref:uncharacterized protein LOC125234914 n=1 Tax=Leguminivora glycinivorella TaxID=1035111 RepID=UPI00200FA913|nr:uncharacterized protein LOC125234914 [Leguminivora glycinivorella]